MFFYQFSPKICLHFDYFWPCLRKFYHRCGDQDTVKQFFPFFPKSSIFGIICSLQNEKVCSFQKLWSSKGLVLHNWQAMCNYEARKYREIPNISPRLIEVRKHFLGGLIFGGHFVLVSEYKDLKIHSTTRNMEFCSFWSIFFCFLTLNAPKLV